MVFFKTYVTGNVYIEELGQLTFMTSSEQLNADITNNPQWGFEVCGYTDDYILVKWSGLTSERFKHYEDTSD